MNLRAIASAKRKSPPTMRVAAWREFMAFQVARTRRMLFDGAPLGRVLAGRIGLEMRMIIAGGDRILAKIERADYDVFRRRPVLRSHDWLLMFARTFAIR